MQTGQNLDHIPMVDKVVDQVGNGHANGLQQNGKTSASANGFVRSNGPDSSDTSSDDGGQSFHEQFVRFFSIFFGFFLGIVSYPFGFFGSLLPKNLSGRKESGDELDTKHYEDALDHGLGEKSPLHVAKPLSRPPSSLELPVISIQNRVEKLESEVIKLARTAEPPAPKVCVPDPASAERIRSLETELAETKKVLRTVLSKQEELCELLERMKDMKWAKKMQCW